MAAKKLLQEYRTDNCQVQGRHRIYDYTIFILESYYGHTMFIMTMFFMFELGMS